MPVMKVRAVGYGMGKKDFTAANCVRAMLGDAEEQPDVVCKLSCNVDDMTAEAVGFAMERLFEAGALEVYTVSVGMKKSRPGTMICALCREQNREAPGDRHASPYHHHRRAGNRLPPLCHGEKRSDHRDALWDGTSEEFTRLRHYPLQV